MYKYIYKYICRDRYREVEREEEMFIYSPIFGLAHKSKIEIEFNQEPKKIMGIFALGHVQQKQNRTKTKYSFNKKRGVEEKNGWKLN